MDLLINLMRLSNFMNLSDFMDLSQSNLMYLNYFIYLGIWTILFFSVVGLVGLSETLFNLA